jgi:hypothetical protein
VQNCPEVLNYMPSEFLNFVNCPTDSTDKHFHVKISDVLSNTLSLKIQIEATEITLMPNKIFRNHFIIRICWGSMSLIIENVQARKQERAKDL